MDTTIPNLLAEIKDQSLWFPVDAAASNQVDPLAYFILIICGVFLVFNAGLMVFFAIRYRQKHKQGTATGQTHNTALEVTWSVIPAFILAIIFYWGFRGYMHQSTPPDGAYDILVTGYKWGWDFTYPNGSNVRGEMDTETGVTNNPALHVPANRPVRLTLQSNDVIHSVSIPAMRVKKDCVPGRYNQMWFEAHFDEATAESVDLPTKEGGTLTVQRNTYDLFCTEYCGTSHSRMITKIHVYAPGDYEKWYASMALIDPGTPLVKLGRSIYETKCATCHSVDGSGTGNYPTWQDLYASTGHKTSAGSITVDDKYIIESIRNPAAQIVDGYGNNMAAFPALTDREIRGLIEYMKTISQYADADDGLTYGQLNLDGTVKTEGADAQAPEGEGDAEPEGEPEAGEPDA